MAWEIEEDAPSSAPTSSSSWKEEQPRSFTDSALETANDFGRAVSNAATFGMANRAKAYIETLKPRSLSDLVTDKPNTYDAALEEQVKRTAQARERSPYASIAGDVYGSLAIPGFGAEAAAARLGSGVLGRAAAYGGTGALTGALQGAGGTYTGNPSDYLENAGIGAAIGAPLGAVGGAAFGARPQVSRAPNRTADELHDVSQHNYSQLAQSKAPYEPSALHDVANDVERRLLADRYHWRDSPATWRAIEEMRGGGAPGQVNTGYNALIDPGSIDFVRKGLNKIPKTEATATDRASAEVVRKALDDFIISPPPGAVLPGAERQAREAATRALEARGNWAGYKRLEKFDDLIENARNTAGATHSGLNLQNELRKSTRSLVRRKAGESEASKAGYSDPEIAGLTDFSRGSRLDNYMRWNANLFGGKGGLGAVAAGGVGGQAADKYFGGDRDAGTAVGVGVPATGMLLSMIGNRRANNKIEALREMISQRNPAFRLSAAQLGTQAGPGSRPAAAKAVRDAITTAIMRQALRPGEE